MEQIVVGLDGSKAATAALTWAARLAIATGADLTAVHAHRHPYAEVPPSEHERMLAERAAILADEWIRPALDLGAAVSTVVVEGDPRPALLESMSHDPVDLLVLGRSGHGGGPGFLHLGSVVEHAVHHTRLPVAVVPSDAHGATRRILVGVDGSTGSGAAVSWCADVAGAMGADVVAVAVAEPPLEWTPSWDDTNWRRHTERELDTWVAPLTDAGIPVVCVISEHLRPADALLGVASARSADLIVVGARGAGGFTALRFGGVALKVLHRTALPLVIVPPREV